MSNNKTEAVPFSHLLNDPLTTIYHNFISRGRITYTTKGIVAAVSEMSHAKNQLINAVWPYLTKPLVGNGNS